VSFIACTVRVVLVWERGSETDGSRTASHAQPPNTSTAQAFPCPSRRNALQDVRETHFRTIQWNQLVRRCSPGGAFELSPALQRWVKWRKRFKSRRDGRVLTYKLQRCNNAISPANRWSLLLSHSLQLSRYVPAAQVG